MSLRTRRKYTFRLTHLSLSLLVGTCFAIAGADHLVGVQHTSIVWKEPFVIRTVRGSGICIDQGCSIVATVYHAQLAAGRGKLHVAGGRSTQVLSLANANVRGVVDRRSQSTKYDISKDIAFIYTQKPIRRKSGIGLSYTSHVGQHIVVAGYYNGAFRTTDATVIGVNVPLSLREGTIAEDLVLDVRLKPGQSGSAILDDRGDLLGIVVRSGVIPSDTGDISASIALPTRTIADVLERLDPSAASSIITGIPREEPGLVELAWTPYRDEDLPEDVSPLIPEMVALPRDIPDAVGRLQLRADAASNTRVNLIARQCLTQGKQKPLCHEVAVVDGHQAFREIRGNKTVGKPTSTFPVVKYGIWTLSDWTEQLGGIADNPWVLEGVVNGHYLFTYSAAAEEDRCSFEEHSLGIPLFGGGHPEWSGSVACFEQVLTDDDFNVVAVFVELVPPDNCATQIFQVATYYDWVKLEGLAHPLLLPVKERIAAKVEGQRNLWYANMSWSHYEQFRAEHRIRF